MQPKFTVSLSETDWNVIAKALDFTVKSNGIEGAKVILPVFDSIAEQLKSQNVADKDKLVFN